VDANGVNDGTSWCNAYNYLQDALTEANSIGGPLQIWVAEGIYAPDTNSVEPNGTGDRTATFRLVNDVHLLGGYAGCGEPDPNLRRVTLGKTILSGDLDGNDIDVNDPCDLLTEPTRSENSYHVVTASGTSDTTVLQGFTITGGNANILIGPFDHNVGGGVLAVNSKVAGWYCSFRNNASSHHGGGMYCSGGQMILYYCTFNTNSALRYGAGLHADGTDTRLNHCTFSNNAGDAVIGLWNNSDAKIMQDCTIEDNLGSGSKAGIHVDNSTLEMSDSSVSNNKGQGSGIYGSRSQLDIDDCTVSRNGGDGFRLVGSGDLAVSADIKGCSIHANDGNGIYCDSDVNAIVTNCSISGNGKRGILCDSNSGLIATNCTITGHRAHVGGGVCCRENSDSAITNCTISGNRAWEGGAGSDSTVKNCILWGNTADRGREIFLGSEALTMTVMYSDIEGGPEQVHSDPNCTLNWGTGNMDSDPCFAEPGHWDANGTPSDANDDFWVKGDYHLRSQAGRWHPNTQSWVQDDVASPCINTGDPNSDWIAESWPHDERTNMGAYGGTPKASMSCFEPRNPADLNGDYRLNFLDFSIFANSWQVEGEFLRPDLNPNGLVDFNDLAVFVKDWLWPNPIQWLINQQDPNSGLVESYEGNGDDFAYIYDQAVAIIAFTEVGELDAAKKGLNMMEYLQLDDPAGAWYEWYHAGDPNEYDWGRMKYVTGPIAWMVIAINYYEDRTGDPNYAPMARRALGWLDGMRNTNANDDRYGSLRYCEGPRCDIPSAVSTEHNVDAYSAYYWRGMLDSNDSYLKVASDILDFLRWEMWAPSPNSIGPNDVEIFLEGYEDCAFATDCQSWAVLALGPLGPDGEQFYRSLHWLLDNPYGTPRNQHGYCGEPNFDGFRSWTGLRSTNCDPNVWSPYMGDRPRIWVEATEGVAAAFYSVGEEDEGNHFHSQMRRIIAPNNGVIHSFSQTDPETHKGFAFNSVASTAWYYFNEARLNPFNLRPSAAECRAANINKAGRVNLKDFAVIASDLFKRGYDLDGDINGDWSVNWGDVSLLTEYWLGECEN
jgi:hypothetical protein